MTQPIRIVFTVSIIEYAVVGTWIVCWERRMQDTATQNLSISDAELGMVVVDFDNEFVA